MGDHSLHHSERISLCVLCVLCGNGIFQERRGATLPAGVAMDKDGKPTRVPSEVATLLPFGGYKGFALALAMQALGVLAGSGLSEDKTYGYLIMAINPELMLPLADFKQHMSDMLAKIKAAPTQPGVDEIRVPGERSLRERARLTREGLTLDRKIYEALLGVRDGPQGALAPLQATRAEKRSAFRRLQQTPMADGSFAFSAPWYRWDRGRLVRKKRR